MLLNSNIKYICNKLKINMKKALHISFLCLCSFVGFAQGKTAIDTSDYSLRTVFIKDFKKSNEDFIKKIKGKHSGKVSKSLTAMYKNFESEFVEEIKDKNYTFKSGLEEYIQSIISDLRKENANIPAKIEVLIEKSNYPNAYCLANNTFVVNMGLFNWLKNRDQMMAVISHELGHNILDHVLNSQVESIKNDLNESSVVKNLREVKHNRTSKAFDLVKNKIYALKALKRQHEKEADSIGYVLYKKSNRNEFEYVNALKNLLDFDTISPKKLSEKIYFKLYDLPNQKFNKKWLQLDDFTTYNYDGFKQKLDKDSIATHPETEERVASLKSTFKELQLEKKSLAADASYKKIRTLTEDEILPNLYWNENYGVGIYTAMQFLENEKEEQESHTFYKEWLGKCFIKIYEGRKNYKLNRYLDTVDPKNQSDSYQQFLNFMWNLKLEEIKNISDFYNKTT